jgi:GH15 family glucan-1,4-alpha-glucosidase
MKKVTLLILVLCIIFGCSQKPEGKKVLAKKILSDTSFTIVDTMARNLLKKGFNAGSGYSQVWARDMNTFVEIALNEVSPKDIRGAILVFFALQQPNDEMIDGYVLNRDFTWGDPNQYRSTADTTHVGFKNTVETDQETSLIQIVGKYVRLTGDSSILSEKIAGETVLKRMSLMIEYLLKDRYSEKYGLLWGAMTADWGDVQPNTDNVVDIDSTTTPAIDVYDNAMFIIALNYMAELTKEKVSAERWKNLSKSIAENTRKHLWDEKKQKFIPHIYLDKSPIPAGFDESEVYYHGSTAIAIEAGLLSKSEIAESNKKMLKNVRLSGAPSIGLTLYPVYPDGLFHGGMAKPYVYQNGGDWTWFGARMIQQLVANGFEEEAYAEIRPMIDLVIKNKGFYEWYAVDGKAQGSAQFKGSAGTLSKAIQMLREWAEKNK